jgi:copper homeostasis protein
VVLEVIATCVADAKMAERSGADRIELISGILEGGLTPSYGLVKEVVRSVSIPVNVIVRPHSRSFCYDRDDVLTMVSDIRAIKQLGASGIVIGMLNENRRIDVGTLRVLLSEAADLDVTFHRAFDEVDDQFEALNDLLSFSQIRRILTSGGKPSAVDAADRIKKLVRLTENTHLGIMAGSGLNLGNIRDFVAYTRVREVHFGSGVRVNQQPLELIDPEKVTVVKKILYPDPTH